MAIDLKEYTGSDWELARLLPDEHRDWQNEVSSGSTCRGFRNHLVALAEREADEPGPARSTTGATSSLPDLEWAEELVSDREYLYTSGPLTIRMYFGPTSMRYLFELSLAFNGRHVILALEESLGAAKDLAQQFVVVVSAKENGGE